MLDINYEKKLIDLLGYIIIGPDNSNRYKILDNNLEVGYIQYKKIYKKNKYYPATYAYITNIDSRNIIYKNTRKVYDNDLKKMEDNNYSYLFEIKNENKNDYIEFSFGDFFNIQIWSKKYGYMTFSIDCNGLHLNYKSETDNYNIEEIILYRSDAYSYQISYSKKNSNNVITCEISGYSLHNNKLRLIENKYINDKLVNNHKSDVIGNIEEMVSKHQMGIVSFNYFRYLIKKILPFKLDIIDIFVTNQMITENKLNIFIDKKKIIKK